MSIILSICKNEGRKALKLSTKTGKTASSQILWITYINRHCRNEYFEALGAGQCASERVSSVLRAPRLAPPTGFFWAESRFWEMYEDLKWRFTWKEKVDGPQCGAARPQPPRAFYNALTSALASRETCLARITVISNLNDVLHCLLVICIDSKYFCCFTKLGTDLLAITASRGDGVKSLEQKQLLV